MRPVPLPAVLPAAVLGLGLLLVVGVLAAPTLVLGAMPAATAVAVAVALYQVPAAFAGLLLLTCALALDFRLDALAAAGASGSLGAAVVKLFPFAFAAALLLRYGPARTVNLPFLAFVVVAAISLVVLPMGRITGFGEMVRSFIGSTAPFVLALAAAPWRVWSTLARGAALVPIVSGAAGLALTPLGLAESFDPLWRFGGMHSAPFLAGFCTTAIFAATLEYLRGFRPAWLVIGGVNLAILLATGARAPLAAVVIFMIVVALAARGRAFPLKRKVDLTMGAVVPGLMLLIPLLAAMAERWFGAEGFNYSGRDIIWPYFAEAIAERPLFGYGLGAGKLIVDPEDPWIRLIGSNAAHNEYLRLSVDAGIIGCAAIVLAIGAWIWAGTRGLPPAERVVLRGALLAVLVHSGFDNTLIASTAVVQFAWFTAALARGRIEADARPRRRGRRA